MLRFVASLVAIFAVILGGIRLGGGKPPTPTLAQLFTNSDGSPCQQPCMFGIQPGKTTMDEAVILLGAHLLTRGYFQFIQFNAVRKAAIIIKGTHFEILVTASLTDQIGFMRIHFLPANWSEIKTLPAPPSIQDVIDTM